MKLINLSMIAVPVTAITLVKTAIVAGALMASAPSTVLGQSIEKKGTTPYVTHFIFRPLMDLDVGDLGKATALEAVGTTGEHEGREDARQDVSTLHGTECRVRREEIYRRCLRVGPTSDGDKIFSTFDTRDLDKSQPKMDRGTHIITGGTGKYKGITGNEPFACISMPALVGPGGYFAMDIPHNTSWEIK